MDNFWNDFHSEQTFNVFLGDEYCKYDKSLSRKDLANIIFQKIPDSLKNRIWDRSSLTEISQSFLDLALSSRQNLISILQEQFHFSNLDFSCYKNFIDGKKFEAIFSMNSFLPLEKYFYDKVRVVFPFSSLEKERAKIPYYRILGTIEKKENMFLSSQDFKKLMFLDFYKNFWQDIRKEFTTRPTLLIGVDLENQDCQKILHFLLKEIRYEKQALYFITSSSILNTGVMNFINQYDIKVLNCDFNDFQKSMLHINTTTEKTPEKAEVEEENEKTISLNFSEDEKTGNHYTFAVDKNIKLEDNLEIQFSSLQLQKFPIHYQNFSIKEEWKEIIPIGSTNVTIGKQTLYHVNLRAFLYENFRLLEFKTREFRLAISVELFNNGFFCREDFLQYEIVDNLLNTRLEYVFNLFQKIFQGESIRFQYNNTISELSVQNELEVLKFKKLSSLLEGYQTSVSNFLNKKEKNFSSLNVSFYSLEILQYYLEGKTEYDAWVNVSLPKGKIQSEDILHFTRILSYPFQYLPYDIEQIYTIKQPLGEVATTENLQLNRKNVSVSLRKIDKTIK